VTYLWRRSCWLLDAHGVSSPVRELIFPGVIGPLILMLGVVVGYWFIASLLMVVFWPQMFVVLTIAAFIIAAPLAAVITFALKWIFLASNEAPASASPEIGDSPGVAQGTG